VCLAAFADRPLAQALAEVHDLGLGLIDLPTDSVFAVRPDDGDDDGLRALLDRYDIRVACVSNSRDGQLILGPHGPQTARVAHGDAAARRAHGERCAYETIRLAGALGAPLVRIFLGCPDFSRWLTWSGADVSWDDNVAAWVDAVTPLAAAADRIGVTLVVEPHPKQVPYDARSVVACVAGARDRGLDVGLCFDPANLAALRYDPVDVLSSMGIVPACVHAKDVELATSALAPSGPGWVAYGPQPAVRFRAVPAGQLAWDRIVIALDRMGFAGPILIEHEDLTCEPSVGIAAARRHLDRLSRMLGPDQPRPAARALTVPSPAPRPEPVAVRPTPWW
jgi:sugar phosphate isomerase/epimerase